MVPYKHVAASVIGWALHEVEHEGRGHRETAWRADVARQTVDNWVAQFERWQVAHLTEHLPQLKAAVVGDAAVTPVPMPRGVFASVPEPRAAHPGQLWCQFLALAAQALTGVPVAERPLHVLLWLQPALSRLRPAVGVFRTPLHMNWGRGPPGG